MNIKDAVVQQGQAIILKQANDNFTLLKNALQADKGIAITVDQSYLSKYDVVDELRKLVKDKTTKPPADIVPLLDSNKSITDIVKEGLFDKLQKYVDGLTGADFEPPLPPAFKSLQNITVYPMPGISSKDPRRTGLFIKPGPPDILKSPEVQKWLVNNSVLYGFVPYSDNGLYYLGVNQIKTELSAAANATDQLKRIVGRFTKNAIALNQLSLTGAVVIENQLPNATSFADPGNLEGLPNNTVKSNEGKILDLVVIDNEPVWRPVALAVLALQAEAQKSGLTIPITSGFRPAYGNNVTVTSTKGRQITLTTQESLRRDRGRWLNRSSYAGSDEDFVFKASADYYKPQTAPPGTSKHGSGVAIDFAVGGRNDFSPLQTTKYVWMIKNAHKFGFVRTVGTEEWHFEYIPDKAKNGPYGALSGASGANKFYTDLGLAQGQFSYTT